MKLELPHIKSSNIPVAARTLAVLLAMSVSLLLVSAHEAPASTQTATLSKKKELNKPRVKITTGTQLTLINRSRVKFRISIPAKNGLGRKARRKARRKPQKLKLSLDFKQSFGEYLSLNPVRVKATPYKSNKISIKLRAKASALVDQCGQPSARITVKGLRGRGHSRWSKVVTRDFKEYKPNCILPDDVDLSKADTCDFIAAPGNACLAPFPNDFYSKVDGNSKTGRRVAIPPEATPRNADGKHIEVTELNQADGFSPGPLISIHIPGMDDQAAFDKTGIVPITEINQTYTHDQPAVLIDTSTGDRQLIWGELDSNATSDGTRNLIIRPGKNLTDGRRYIVALRGMKRADGSMIEAPAGFRLYRDTTRTDNPTVEGRRNRFDSIFKTLKAVGIKRESLYLAWDFTVASTENLTGRMLSIRNRAFADLGDANLTDGTVQGIAPEFTVDSAVNNPNAENARTVTGTFQVPCYLNAIGCPSGSTFNLDDEQDPIRIPGNMMTARFTCNIPNSAVNDLGGGNFEVDHKVRPSLYGHGLFGSYTETNTGNVRKLGNENNVMVCGTDWSGMSSEDIAPAALPALLDLSKFPALPDRLQQGFLNFLFLGRMMIHPDGFTGDPAFQFGGESVIDTSDLFYYGNSQGGIAGGALTAVATDFTRSVLYVPGMNYSTLLTRSTDFETYKAILYPRYQSEVERPAMFALMQMLWDRGEPNGYASHMTDNHLPGTPAHKVMIEMAYGDHQVANVATEVEARTIGAALRQPALNLSRQPAGMIEPFYGHQTLGDLAGPAANGNAFFIWDIGPKRIESLQLYGTDPPPLTNTAPVTSDGGGDGSDGSGIDPHDTVINQSPLIRKQIADFLTTGGKVTNPCGLNPCYAAGWMGFP